MQKHNMASKLKIVKKIVYFRLVFVIKFYSQKTFCN
jgi:hypothetical protein